MVCLSVLVAVGMTELCLGASLPQPPPHHPLCPLQHSCSVRNTSHDSVLGCSCDATCRTYGDCCRDSHHYQEDQQRKAVKQYWCVKYGKPGEDNDYVYMRRKCPKDWDNPKVRRLCRKRNTLHDSTKRLPVTNTTTGRTYVNHYCAICNGEDPAHLRMWNAIVECDVLSRNGSTEDYAVVFHDKMLGVIVPRLGVSSFTPCSSYVTMPQDIKNSTTPCVPTVATCPLYSWPKKEKLLCQSYAAPVYAGNNGKRYRNQHCASCNGHNEYTCEAPVRTSGLAGDTSSNSHSGVTAQLTMLLDFTVRNGSNLGELIRPCGPQEVWDNSFGKCREVICPKPSEKFSHDRCVPVEGDATLNTEKQELVCPFHHFCSVTNTHDRRCSCDASCRIYGDCCRDSGHYNNTELKNVNEYMCVEYTKAITRRDACGGDEKGCIRKDHVYMRGKCSEDWDNAEVRTLCLKGNKPYPSKRLPVTNTTTGRTYVNHYCAICNGQDPAYLRMWSSEVDCRASFKYADNEDFAIMFHNETWGVILPYLGLSSFTPCSTHVTMPDDIRNLTTPCVPTVATCSDPGSGEHEQTLCQSYAAPVYHGGTRFRNQHCASCNGYTGYTCESHPPSPSISPDRTTSSHLGTGGDLNIDGLFTSLLDFRDGNGSNLVGWTGPCDPEELWDKDHNMCREIICPKPGEKFSYGRCVPVEDDATLNTKKQALFCSFRHSCSVTNTHDRGCSCDATCGIYGDCCTDSEYFDEVEQFKAVNQYICLDHAYTKVKCLEDWDNRKVRRLCLKGNTLHDPTKRLPVTNTTTGRTYVNHYCAICNGEDPAYLRMWNAVVECDVLSRNGSTEDYAVVFHDEMLGVIVPRLGVSSFTPCSSYVTMPQDIKNSTTPCVPTVATCPLYSWPKKEKLLCQSYAAPVYAGNNGKRYRNQHCASCNGHNEYTCEAPVRTSGLAGDTSSNSHSGVTAQLTMLLDFTVRNGSNLGELIRPCGPQEVWDNSFGKCREVICPKPSEKFSHDRCVPVEGDATLNTEKQELVCPFHHFCSVTNTHNRWCSCDATCRIYGDCCRDSVYFDKGEHLNNVNEYMCVKSTNDPTKKDHVYMRGKCSEDWDNAEVQTLCLKGNTLPDPTKRLPVISTTTGRTYVNHYCAICNGQDPAYLRMWNSEVECRASSTYADEDFAIMFHNEKWGVIVPYLGLPSFTPCSTHVTIPDDIRNFTTPCVPTVATCSDPGSGEHEQTLCQSYAAPVYHDGTRFRNQHCASCNGYTGYTCEAHPLSPSILAHEVTTFTMSASGHHTIVSFTSLLDIRDRSGSNLVGLTGSCGPEELWDKWARKCREIICPKPGEKFSYGSCVPVGDDATLNTEKQALFCPLHHSCSRTSTHDRGCSCDATCRIYGDCCIDSEYYNKSDQMMNVNEYMCVKYTKAITRIDACGGDKEDRIQKDHVYMRGKCLEDWDNAEVQTLCLKGSKPYPSKRLPVTNTTTGRTYVNHYCAICNGQDPAYLRMWNSEADCYALFANANDDFVIVFHNETWGVIVPYLGLSSFTPCSTYVTMPDDIRNLTTPCVPTVTTCSDPGSGEHEQILCQSYAAPVYHGGSRFRNQHCASCNGYIGYTCEAHPPPSIWQHRIIFAADRAFGCSFVIGSIFTSLLDIKHRSDSNPVGLTGSCGPEELWDKWARKCREIICTKPGEKFSYGSCVPVDDDATLNTEKQALLCSFRHSCSATNTRNRECSCDATCRIYGDCCPDSEYYDEDEQRKNVNNYMCVDHAYTKVKCSEDWDNAEVQALCLKGNTQPDPMKRLPVTSTTTGRTYVNHYCAICNGEDPAYLRMWYAELKCLQMSRYGYQEDYTIVVSDGAWGVFVPRLGLSSLTPCFSYNKMPENIRNITKPCVPTITTCYNFLYTHIGIGSAEWKQWNLCHSYTAPVYSGSRRFRNPHCASCSGYAEYTCEKEGGHGGHNSVERGQISIVLDFTDRSGSNVTGSAGPCGPEEVWDRLSQKCREIVCPKPGERFSYNRCIPFEDDPKLKPEKQELLCPFHHSCSLTNTQDRGCSCAATCRIYGDCCPDSDHFDEYEQKKNVNEYMCVECTEYPTRKDHVYMRGKCLEDWDNTVVEALCLKGNTLPDSTKRLPVTNTTTGRTYVNHYCAICNGEDPSHLRMWTAYIMCKRPYTGENYNGYDIEIYDGEWRVIIAQDGYGVPTPCHTNFAMPMDVKNLSTPCVPTVKTCSDTGSGEHERTLCQSSAAAVYHGDTRYRNQHCASCNGHREYTCEAVPPHHLPPDSLYQPMIFDLSDHPTLLVALTSPCGPEEAWDRWSEKCRKIFCLEYSEKFSNGRCVPVEDYATLSSEARVNASTIGGSRTVDRTQMVKSPRMPFFAPRIKVFATLSLMPTARNAADPIHTAKTNSPRPLPTSAPTSAVPINSHRATEKPTAPITGKTNSPYPLPTSAPTTGVPVSQDPQDRLSLPPNTTQSYDDCLKTQLSEEEFSRQTNGSVYVPAYGRTYQAGEYEAREGGVVVCWPADSGHKFSPKLGWVSLAGLCFSCLALVLHLTAFCLVPSLRNLPGQCLASLCLSLLAAYATLLLSMMTPPSQAGCTALAAAMYYFFLCSFAWMTAISFDVWYTFRLTQKELRMAGGSQRHRFLAYSLCSWLLPAVSMAVLVTVDQLEPQGVSQDFLPRLGEGWCWFSHRKSLLVFFATPMAALTLINVVFFAGTAALIAKMARSAAAAAAGTQRPKWYWTFMRLAVLMGLTWTTGILAGCLDLEALWYVFVVLNSLQGVFIFLAFTCRAKVFQAVGCGGHRLLQRAVSVVTRRHLQPDPSLELQQMDNTTRNDPNSLIRVSLDQVFSL